MINDDMGGGSRTKNRPEIDDDDDDDDYYYVDDDDNPKGQFGDTDCVETCWVVLCKDVKKYGDRWWNGFTLWWPLWCLLSSVALWPTLTSTLVWYIYNIIIDEFSTGPQQDGCEVWMARRLGRLIHKISKPYFYSLKRGTVLLWWTHECWWKDNVIAALVCFRKCCCICLLNLFAMYAQKSSPSPANSIVVQHRCMAPW